MQDLLQTQAGSPTSSPFPRQVLPDAVHRGGRGYQDDFRSNQIRSVAAPLGTLFDVDHLLAWGRSADAVLHTVRISRHITDPRGIAAQRERSLHRPRAQIQP